MPLTRAEQWERDYEQFVSGFRRNRKGNLWRRWNEALVLTVYPDRNGEGWNWCITSELGPEYAAAVYETEADALEALWEVVRDF